MLLSFEDGGSVEGDSFWYQCECESPYDESPYDDSCCIIIICYYDHHSPLLWQLLPLRMRVCLGILDAPIQSPKLSHFIRKLMEIGYLLVGPLIWADTPRTNISSSMFSFFTSQARHLRSLNVAPQVLKETILTAVGCICSESMHWFTGRCSTDMRGAFENPFW